MDYTNKIDKWNAQIPRNTQNTETDIRRNGKYDLAYKI